MSRRCQLTGRGVATGNNVSHANNRTRRRFLPNLQNASFFSPTLNMRVRLRISVHALRSLEKKGGLDPWLVAADHRLLGVKARRLRQRLLRVRAKPGSAS